LKIGFGAISPARINDANETPHIRFAMSLQADTPFIPVSVVRNRNGEPGVRKDDPEECLLLRMHLWVPVFDALLGSGECGKASIDGKLAQTELDTIFAINCRQHLPRKAVSKTSRNDCAFERSSGAAI
jgi:hypothetical protein